MKTSNKILLGLFLTILLVFTAIHVALYAKYKSGDYTIASSQREQRFTKTAFSHIHYVSATGLQNFTIIPSDTLQLEIEKEGPIGIRYQIIGDSLIIHGDTLLKVHTNEERRFRSYHEVNLYLPSMDRVDIDFCEVWLRGQKDSARMASYSFQIKNASSFHLSENEYGDSSNSYLNRLSVRSSSSHVELSPNIIVDALELDSKESEFDDKNAKIGKLMIQADSNSNITLNGSNLRKLNAPVAH